ncbi:MAG TPA: thioredoxin domain-containing protein [Hyphomonas sp.]|nr:thioredoxin domain-containing protein [Hyphomonas sp.]MCA8903611.1 thioredoxin domain-containing protein [Hyphomonas sp.]MCB9962800.1 thioredoxin domain-containing protein [Hyphomonas sp.]HPE47764.1 thioredoxin domain-containing protein [Hyphomonas sp.]
MASMTRRLALAAFAALAMFVAPASAEWSEWDAASELGWSLGDADAPLTVIEYFSPTCSHCKEFEEDVMPAVKKDYIETGKVRFVKREYIRNDVDTAIVSVARCLGGETGLAFLGDVFARQDDIFAAASAGTVPDTLVEIGQPHGLADRAAFDTCYADMNIRFDMVAVQQSASHYRIHATPTFVVGGTVKAASTDIMTSEGFSAFLDAELAKVPPVTN